jgi:hypothetical protein
LTATVFGLGEEVAEGVFCGAQGVHTTLERGRQRAIKTKSLVNQ